MDTIPQKLRTHNLHVNISKTEKHSVDQSKQSESWKKCKYLGTMLDTSTDIQRRKSLTYVAFNKYKKILTKRSLPLTLRMRLFEVYATSIFMYNSELWTLTKSEEKKIDAFHRSFLRQILNKRYPNIISNKNLY